MNITIKKQNFLYLYLIVVAFIAYFTYFKDYQNPPKQFWDENYHVVSAQKYIDGVVYMETHPPLGKLLIALGEHIISANKDIDTSEFLKTDYQKKFPKNYSFEGMRLFPTLFATFNALLFFLICYKLTENAHLGFLFSSLYLFDNALIVHSRAAMLESTQLFFIFLTVLYFIYTTKKERIKLYDYVVLGLIIGFGLAVKLNGLIMILLPFFLIFYEYERKSENLTKFFLLMGGRYLIGIFSMLFVFVAVFYVSFALTTKMPTHKKYNISKEYEEIIKKGETSSLSSLYVMLRDNLIYIKNYSKGVPKFNPCKKGENGSLCTTWAFGNKSINYRWERDEDRVKYLYLQGNPIIWFSGVIAIILASSLVVSRYVYNLEPKDKRVFRYILFFTFMYFSYMFVMFNIERVMYLYHYFVPLIFSLILFVLVISYIYKEEIYKKSKLFLFSVLIFAINIVIVYKFFAPLSYYEPIDTYEFEKRVWFDFWRLESVK